MHPFLAQNGGQDIYFTVSEWGPYAVSRFHAHLERPLQSLRCRSTNRDNLYRSDHCSVSLTGSSRAALKARPDEPLILLNLGAIAIEHRQRDGALAELRRSSVRSEPSNSVMWP
jgi:hypothetical protein